MLGPLKIVKGHPCPRCKCLLDSVNSTEGLDLEPAEDDFTICLNCTTPLRFNADLSVRNLTPQDWAEVPNNLIEFMVIVKKSRGVKTIGGIV